MSILVLVKSTKFLKKRKKELLLFYLHCMPDLHSVQVQCPYCWEMLELSVDSGTFPSCSQEFVEDCHVCCQPMRIQVEWDENNCPFAEANREND